MSSSSAYLLVTHGSRDRRPQIAVERLAQLVSQQLHQEGSPKRFQRHQEPETNRTFNRTATITKLHPLVGTAALELAPLSLNQSIQQFARQAQRSGTKQIQILPLFLLPGVHVKEDIPEEVALAQQALGEEIQLVLQPYLGSYPGIKRLLAQQFEQHPSQARILLSHGSRRPGSKQIIEAIAAELEAVAAYWSVSPSLPQQISTLVAAGTREIAIVPYFLFSGGITEAIRNQVTQLQQDLEVLLALGEPLGATPELANLIVKEIGT